MTDGTRLGLGRLMWVAVIALAAACGCRSAAPSVARELLIELGNGVTMELVQIPAGTFRMGSRSSSTIPTKADELPAHRVRITRPSYLGKYEVTLGQFRQFVEATGYKTDAEKGGQPFINGWKGGVVMQTGGTWHWDGRARFWFLSHATTDSHPVELVSWNDATAFCEWLSGKVGRKCRLPTEAEWEYACRAQTQTLYPWGNYEDPTGRAANLADPQLSRYLSWGLGGPDDGHAFTAPVGSYRPNEFGLHDMIGNVQEWCSDWYSADYYRQSARTDPTGPRVGDRRVIRGGSWYDGLTPCARRTSKAPAYRGVLTGFRVLAETH